VQDAGCAVHAQIIDDVAFRSHPPHQGFRLVNIQIVDDEMPAGDTRIAGNNGLHMRQEIGFRARRSHMGCQHMATRYITTDDKRQGSMPDIFKLTPFDLPWLHR
jgi:hypothetical protein